MASDAEDVLAANEAFYAAFAARDPEAMDRLWARRAPVACIHPGWDALRGRDDVVASWHAILEGEAPPPITCSGATAHVLGRSAYVICFEDMPGARLVATNVFVRERGRWKMVHHQASVVARSTEELERNAPDESSEKPN